MAVSRQKGKARVSTHFYMINLNAWQSGKANDSASIVKRAKERFRNSQRPQKAQPKANRNAAIIERV